MPYPEATHLTFNHAAIANEYVIGHPDQDIAGTPGFWLLLQNNTLLVQKTPQGLRLPFGSDPVPGPFAVPPVFIGTWQGKALRTARLSTSAAIPESLAAVSASYRSPVLDDQLLTLSGLARQVLHWRDRSRICPSCGGAPREIPGTYGARCPSCGREYYPRIHPAVIVLIQRDDEYLMVRKPDWPAGQYGLVAGFVEFAESFEECVIREVQEETGLSITDIRYAASQNWPFPSQIMAGFTARYAGGELVVDTTELEQAAWFSSHNPPPALPPRSSIARLLLDRYAPALVAATPRL